MARPKRPDRAPVTLAWVQGRCIEEGDCWIWQGAKNSHAIPVIGWRDKEGRERTGNVRRVVATLMGLDLSGGLVATCSCKEPLCVSPKHVVAVTRSKMQKEWAAQLKYHNHPVRRAKLSAAARARSPHSEATIALVREMSGTLTQREIARRLGLNFNYVNKVVRHKVRQTMGGNPFAGMGAR